MPSKLIKNNWIYFYLSIQIASLLYITSLFFNDSFLPRPFVLDKSNTFMDFYNPLSWVYNSLIYETTKTVYPPLNFVLLKLISFIFSYFGIQQGSAEILRAQSAAFQMLLVGNYLLVAFISVYININNELDRFHSFILALSLAISTPVLFAIERGNLIIFALLFLSFYIASRDKKSIHSIILVAILINIKPYFLLLFIIYLRNLNKLFILVCWSGLIFVITGLIIDQHFYLLFTNLLFFNNIGGGIPPLDQLAFPSSVIALKAMTLIMPPLHSYFFWFSVLKSCLYITIAILIFLIIFKKNITDSDKLIGVIMIITNYSVMSGGYSLIYYLPILPILVRDGNKNLFFCVLFILAPLDWIQFYKQQYPGLLYSYLGSTAEKFFVMPNAELYIGTILRPIINLWLIASFTYYLNKKKKL